MIDKGGSTSSSRDVAMMAKVLEAFYVLPPDVPKDSSTEITCIMRALDSAMEILEQRGVKCPEHLVIEAELLLAVCFNELQNHVNFWSCTLQTDNCSREGKNQVIAKMSATAVIMQRLLA